MRGRNGHLGIALVACLAAGGCAVGNMGKKIVHKPGHPAAPVLTASKQQLVEQYNRQAQSITDINAKVLMKLTAGTELTGIVKRYHEVSGFIVAQAPSGVRVIGQAPVVGTTIFDMVSDGSTFRISLPTRNEFIEGPANLERPSNEPIANLRPQHLLDALFWPPVAAQTPVLIEQVDTQRGFHYYVLDMITGAPASQAASAAASADSAPPAPATPSGSNVSWRLARKIWFDRTNLAISRVQIYDRAGSVNSDIRYRDWSSFGEWSFPREITLARPANGYQLQISITRLTIDAPLGANSFTLKQPPGSRLIEVSGAVTEPRRH